MQHDNAIGLSSLDVSGYDQLNDGLAKTVFVIPSVNGARLLERMLPTLKIPSHIIYVLDQGSDDATEAVCNKYDVNLVQLSSRRTYTECCNIALDIAIKQDAEYFFVSNNDITFITDVARELLFEISLDPALGILSCSQIITDEQRSNPILSSRVFWNLEKVGFDHQTSILESDYYRLESDFCELTFAVMRTSAVSKVGGFDDKFGFYHEDADLGFRLREAGYTTAYLPQSQIEHFAGSTFRQGLDQARLKYIANSKRVFEQKHLGAGINYPELHSDIPSSWTIINKNLFGSLRSLGLIDQSRPALTFSHPGERPFEYLYSVWETSILPK
ncbi:glycosyltransferase family 2 protein [Lichenihabitans psoromatis]|uniref:glycosyltransferase family 2 protein n=1 Tax=Lichenihabitans psoromatis TaxID=2528642 RepID=UPI001036CFA4|nr:glycosyltransferase family 2 protein [Lichenihabitans psoromatis]